MVDIRREPDWDQGANRHSELVDPVLTVRQLSRFDHRKGYSRIDNALVFTTDKGSSMFTCHLIGRRALCSPPGGTPRSTKSTWGCTPAPCRCCFPATTTPSTSPPR